jgi:hypothetical protein
MKTYEVTDGERFDHEHRHEPDHGPGCDGPWNCTCPPLTAGFSCPDHGITADARTIPGSLLPHCHQCGRVVVQVEDTDSEAF